MGTRRPARWLVAALLLLSGCNAFPAGPGSTTTVTPAEIPAPATPSAQAWTGDSFDGSRAATTHARTLRNTSYTVNQTILTRFTNGTIARRSVTRARFSAGERANVTRTWVDRRGADTQHRTVRRFQVGATRYRLVVADGERTRTVTNGTGYGVAEYREVLANGGPVARVFGYVDVQILNRYTEDGTRYVDVASVRPVSVPPLSNVSLTATVSERGVIRSYRVSYGVERGGTRLRTAVTLSYTAVGRTTVDRPAWVDQGVRASRATPGNRSA